MIEDIQYVVAGRAFAGVLATPQAEPRGGITVFHGGGGLGDHDRMQCRRLAELGYAAFAPDLFGEPFRDRAHGMAVIGALVADPDRLRERAIAAWRVVADRGLVTAAVGHCFGGLVALELARAGADVSAVASFHGGLATRAPAQPGKVRARILICTGADDPHAPRDARNAIEDELTAAAADWRMLVLGGARHGFTLEGDAYHGAADRRSWRAFRELLDEVMPEVHQSAA
ncbi:MAG TPA: dienelactone hydrolase family protein [Kofleriaceae bacterium]|jgi:dienelactone hydrolase